MGNQEQKYRILYVDDNVFFVDIFSRMFKKHFDITPANSGEEALEKLENQSFDLIVTDYKMPDISGIDLFNRVKQKHADTPVIFLTCMENEALKQEALNSGIADFILKDTLKAHFRENVVQVINTTIKERIEEKIL